MLDSPVAGSFKRFFRQQLSGLSRAELSSTMVPPTPVDGRSVTSDKTQNVFEGLWNPAARVRQAAEAATITDTSTAAGDSSPESLLQALRSIRSGQDDPAAAALQLQHFLEQCRRQYGPEMDARIDAACSQLQMYLDGTEAQQAGIPLPGPYASIRGIVDSMTSTLDWVSVVLRNPPVALPGADGRAMTGSSGPGASGTHEAAHLMEASTALRGMVQELSQASASGAVRADEREAIQGVGQQLHRLADKLDVAAARRAVTAAAAGAEAAGISTAAVPGPEGLEPTTNLLDGVHTAVAQDGGVHSLFRGIQELGHSIASAMEANWSGAPPITKLVAYLAAIAAVIFLVRARVPQVETSASTARVELRGAGEDAMPPAAPLAQARGTADSQDWSSDVSAASYASQLNGNGGGGGNGRSRFAQGISNWGTTNTARPAFATTAAGLNGGGLAYSSPGSSSHGGSSSSSSGGGVGSSGMLNLVAEEVLTMPSPAASNASAAAAAAVLAALNAEDRKVTEVVRAGEYRRQEKDRLLARDQIKERLRWVTRVMGPFSAIVPAGEPVREEVDRLIGQLEVLTPTDKPLNLQVDAPHIAALNPLAQASRPDPRLLGEWRLVYASSGTSGSGNTGNLLAQFLHIMDSLPGFGMSHLVQRLYPDALQHGFIVMENSAVFRFGLLGSWRLSATGKWMDNGGGMCAQSWFESLGIKPVDALGGILNNLPELVVPIPETIRMPSEWCTTYLDANTRIGRGGGGAGSGNLFLFEKV